jgi:hypothetical protein
MPIDKEETKKFILELLKTFIYLSVIVVAVRFSFFSHLL